jgi:uncharacterized membrane protein
MDQKTIAWVSYLTLVGWIISIVSYNGSADKSPLAKFHLRQSLGIMLTGILIYILAVTAIFSFGFFATLVWILDIGIFILWLLGIISATQGQEKPVPVLGVLYQKILTFIN